MPSERPIDADTLYILARLLVKLCTVRDGALDNHFTCTPTGLLLRLTGCLAVNFTGDGEFVLSIDVQSCSKQRSVLFSATCSWLAVDIQFRREKKKKSACKEKTSINR